MASQGIKTYQQSQFKTTVDNRKIVILLYEGIVQNLSMAISAVEAGDKKTMSAKINKALQIVHFMTCSLDSEQGGDIATNLSNLYDYVRDIVTMANIKSQTAPLREAIDIINTILEGWRQIASAPLPTNETAGAAVSEALAAKPQATRAPLSESAAPSSPPSAEAPAAPPTVTGAVAYGKRGTYKPTTAPTPQPVPASSSAAATGYGKPGSYRSVIG